MSEYHDARTPAAEASSRTAARPMAAREQLERLYREIGIPAVAAAAAQLAQPLPKADAPVRELPACLRDDAKAA